MMETKKITGLIEKINAAISNSKFPELSRIEYDLLMQHVRDLYEELAPLANSKDEHVKKETEKSDTVMPPDTLPIRKMLHSNDKFLNDIQPKQEETKKVKSDETVVTRQETKTTNRLKSSSINESIKSSGSLNEKLKSPSKKEVHKLLSTKPLKETIDLNKKFVLVNELFKGNSEAFSSTINQIDAFEDFASAESYISSHQWDKTSQSFELLIKLVKQRFGEE